LAESVAAGGAHGIIEKSHTQNTLEFSSIDECLINESRFRRNLQINHLQNCKEPEIT